LAILKGLISIVRAQQCTNTAKLVYVHDEMIIGSYFRSCQRKYQGFSFIEKFK
jgi:hypothetical protein